MAEKVVTMVLKVDLQCTRCYKKVKQVLCKFPREIREQKYDEKQNAVTIKVVCCNPEKLRDKLCCKGCGTIKSIEIKEPPPKLDKKPPTQGKPQNVPPAPVVVNICVPVHGYPPAYPIGLCCRQCCEGHGGGPCYQGYGRPAPCCDGCAGRFIYDSYGGGRACYEENPSGCSTM